MTDNVAIDKCLGKRTRLRRTLLGMSQEQLGVALNITFQQFQKYERGAYGVSASRLWDVSQILDVPTSFFFEDMTDDVMKSSLRHISRGDEQKMGEDPFKILWRDVKLWSLCARIIRSFSQYCVSEFLRSSNRLLSQ